MRKRAICDEELEGENRDRRASRRNTKRVRHIEDDNDKMEEDVDEEEEEDEDNEQQSTQDTNEQTAHGLLRVTCGNKKGMLDVEKLRRGEKCIECEGRWFVPSAFEILGGKGSCKKWKASILYDDKPLHVWLEQGHITTKRFKRSGSETAKQKKIPSSSSCTSDSSCEESEIQAVEEPEEDEKNEDKDNEELQAEEEEEERTPPEVVVVKIKEEEYEMEKREMEDKDWPAVAERQTELIILTPGEMGAKIMRKELKVLLKRLLMFQSDGCESNCTERPAIESEIQAVEEAEEDEKNEDKELQAEEEEEETVPPEDGEEAVEIKEEEDKMEHEEMEDDDAVAVNDNDGLSVFEGRGTASSTVSLDEDALNEEQRDLKSKPEIQHETEDTSLTSSDTMHLSLSPDASLVGDNADATTSGPDATQSQGTKLDTWCPQASDSTHSSDIVEGPSERPCTGTIFNMDDMDLDQLRREKIKMQLKVLKLQEEYYSLKVKELKNDFVKA